MVCNIWVMTFAGAIRISEALHSREQGSIYRSDHSVSFFHLMQCPLSITTAHQNTCPPPSHKTKHHLEHRHPCPTPTTENHCLRHPPHLFPRLSFYAIPTLTLPKATNHLSHRSSSNTNSEQEDILPANPSESRRAPQA